MLLQLLPLVLAMSGQATTQQQPPQAAPVQRPAQAPRKIYNETADARAQIAAALESVGQDDIRVLINWGANDDENCTKFQQGMYGGVPSPSSQQIRQKFADEFRVVSVDVGHFDKNQDLARSYGGPSAGAPLPHLTILDKTGKVLAQQSSREFAGEAGAAAYAPEKFLAFLAKYQAPPPPEAKPALTAAIAKAKAENKEVFLWFSAPW